MAKKRGHNEGSISQLTDGRWQGRISVGYKDGKPQRKAVYGKTRQEAAEKVTRLLANMQQGIMPKPQYLILHRDAQLSIDEKRRYCDWTVRESSMLRHPKD